MVLNVIIEVCDFFGEILRYLVSNLINVFFLFKFRLLILVDVFMRKMMFKM